MESIQGRHVEAVVSELLGDPNPSLSSASEWRFGRQGSLAIKLDAGTWYDHEQNCGGGLIDLVHQKLNCAKSDAAQWLEARGISFGTYRKVDRTTSARRIVATYDYTDADGCFLFQVVRFEPKHFQQRCRDITGAWRWSLKGTERVLYRLLDLAAAATSEPVFLVEGEKDADRLAALGLVATTVPGGAKKWFRGIGAPLSGRRVVVLPDNDPPGHDHAALMVRELSGVAQKVAILSLEGLPAKGDVSDWLDRGGTAERLRALAEAGLEAPPVEASKASAARPAGLPSPVPDPIDLYRPRDPAPDIPRQFLGPLAPAVEAIAERAQAPAALAMQSVLAAAAYAVQAHADVETLGGRSPTSLFLLSVARSGERKSACFAPAVAPIQRIEEEEIEGYARRLRRYEDAHAIWEVDRKRLIAGSDVIERDADLEALEEPTAPLCPHRIFEDVTFEGLLRSFDDGQPSVAIFTDEGAQILGGYAMRSENKAKSGGDFSKLWSGSAQGRARAGSAVPTSKYIGRRVSCHLMVQPRIAEQATGDVEIRDQGFWARCLIAWPETSFGTRLHKTHDRTAPALEAYDRHLEALLRCAPPTAADARILRPRLLSLSPEAKEHLIAYHDAAEREIAPDGRLAEVADFASKSAEQAARIAAVLTLYENPDATLVTPEAMENATGLADWYLFEAERIFGTRAVSPLTKDAEKLLGWILKRNAQTITIHEANHCGPKPLRAVATLDPLFALLERLNWLLPIPSPGRKATWWINRP